MVRRPFIIDGRQSTARGLVWLGGPGPPGGPLQYDMSGRGNNAVLLASATWTATERGMTLDVSGESYTKVTHAAVIDFADVSFSVSVWFYPLSIANAFNYLCCKNYGGPGVQWWGIYMQSDGTLTFVCDDGANNVVAESAAATVSTNRWYHVVGVRMAAPTDLMYLFLDGVLLDTSDCSAVGDTSNAGNFYTGMRADLDNQREFSGFVNEQRIYNRGLRAADVQHIYQKTWAEPFSDIAMPPRRVFKAPAAAAGKPGYYNWRRRVA